MSVDVRRGKEIYGTDGGWFQARWHFSFDHYRDPGQMGVGALRVFNDDRLQVICRMPGNLVSPRPERLGNQHRDEEGGHRPPAAKDLKEATGQRSSSSGHLGLLTRAGRSLHTPYSTPTQLVVEGSREGRQVPKAYTCLVLVDAFGLVPGDG
jgi:hypothetical protein